MVRSPPRAPPPAGLGIVYRRFLAKILNRRREMFLCPLELSGGSGVQVPSLNVRFWNPARDKEPVFIVSRPLLSRFAKKPVRHLIASMWNL